MKRQILLCCCILFSQFSLTASHVMGGNMRYQSLDSGKYLITATIYRDCRGIALSAPNFGVYAGNSGSNACGAYSISGLTRISIREVTNRCSTTNSQCSPANTSATGVGVEEHVYTCTVDVNKAPFTNFKGTSCCEITFYINIPTSINPYNNGTTAFNMVLMMNRCNLNKVPSHHGKNSSPVYSNLPKHFLCCFVGEYEAQGAIDTIDNDSISYRLEKLRQNLPSSGISYPSPFSTRYFLTPYCKPSGSISCSPNPAANPPLGLYFNAGTGDIVFTPTNCFESAWKVMETDEFRQDSSGKWLNVGMSMLVVNYNVLDACGYNNSPVISGTQVNSVCAGDKICFNITGKDETFTPFQTTPDTVLMSWDGAIPGAVFTVTNPGSREKTVEFCWQTKVEHQRDHAWRFSVTAIDQHCPVPARSSASFAIYVQKKIIQDTPSISVIPCRQIRLHSKADSVAKQKVKWVLTDTTGKKLAESAKARDTLNLNYTGMVYVQQIISNMNCKAYRYDSVVLLPKPVLFLGNDTGICRYDSLSLSPSMKHAKYPVAYAWNLANNPSFQTSDSLLTLHIHTDTSIYLAATDNSGCTAFDTVHISKLGHTNPIMTGKLPNFCFTDQTLDLTPYLKIPGATPQSDTVYSDSAGLISHNNTWLIHPTGLNPKYLKSGVFTPIKVFVKYTDTNTCKYKDSFWVKIAGNPQFQLQDSSYCQKNTGIALGELVHQSGNHSGSWHWSVLAAPAAVKDSLLLDTTANNNGEFALLKTGYPGNKAFAGNYTISLLLTDSATGCNTLDSASIAIRANPHLQNVTSPAFCQSNTSINLLPYILLDSGTTKANDVQFTIYSFNGSTTHPYTSSISNDTLFTATHVPGNWQIQTLAHNNGCSDTLYWNILISANPMSQFILSPDSLVFLPSGTFTSTNTSTDSGLLKNWLWITPGATTDSSTAWQPQITYTQVGQYKVSLLVVNHQGCRDTAFQTVRVDNKSTAIHTPNLQAATIKINGQLQILQPQVQQAVLYLYDASGRIVYTATDNTGIQNFSGMQGVYFYRIHYSAGTINQQTTGSIFIQK